MKICKAILTEAASANLLKVTLDRPEDGWAAPKSPGQPSSRIYFTTANCPLIAPFGKFLECTFT